MDAALTDIRKLRPNLMAFVLKLASGVLAPISAPERRPLSICSNSPGGSPGSILAKPRTRRKCDDRHVLPERRQIHADEYVHALCMHASLPPVFRHPAPRDQIRLSLSEPPARVVALPIGVDRRDADLSCAEFLEEGSLDLRWPGSSWLLEFKHPKPLLASQNGSYLLAWGDFFLWATLEAQKRPQLSCTRAGPLVNPSSLFSQLLHQLTVNCKTPVMGANSMIRQVRNKPLNGSVIASGCVCPVIHSSQVRRGTVDAMDCVIKAAPANSEGPKQAKSETRSEGLLGRPCGN